MGRALTRLGTDARTALALALVTSLALAFVAVRTTVYHPGYVFLVWNLFLAWIPLGLAHAAAGVARRAAGRSGWRAAAFALGLGWLAFLPNAPYIATDLMHLRTTRGAPLWIDALTVGTAATTGVLLGLASTRVVHAAVRGSAAARLGWLVPVAAALASGFGVYLGRVLRWNTWDILTRPAELLQSAWDALSETAFVVYALTFAFAFGVAYLAWALVFRGEPPRASPSSGPSPESGQGPSQPLSEPPSGPAPASNPPSA